MLWAKPQMPEDNKSIQFNRIEEHLILILFPHSHLLKIDNFCKVIVLLSYSLGFLIATLKFNYSKLREMNTFRIASMPFYI